MKAVVVGGGVGGLTAALALSRAGWEIELCEQAPAFEEVGAGLQISPNGAKILDRLGVTKRLERTLFEPEFVDMRLGKSGRRIFSIPMRDAAVRRWGGRYFQIHRADLADALQAELEAVAPGAARTGARVAGYAQTPDGAAVLLENGEAIGGDLVIGADGVRSAIRTQMLGPEAPRFTGYVAWRAIAPVSALKTPPPMGATAWSGIGQHAVTTRLRAGTLANVVGVVEADWREEGWDIEGRREAALADFEGWVPEVRDVFGAAEVVHRWALYDRAPLPRWSDGRVVLLGDACHPMLPSYAQGAVQAIEDAWSLARKLEGGDVAAALAAHFAARITRASRVQALSRRNLRLYHLKNRPFRAFLFTGMWATNHVLPVVYPWMQDWLMGADPE